jgi:DALR anticodon binding domain
MITADLRRAIRAAVGPDRDPLLRPGPVPGSYTTSLPFRLNQQARQALTEHLKTQPWIAGADRTGNGYLTITVTHEALATLAVRITRAGPACAASDTLAGRPLPAPAADFTAQLTARLATTAGATFSFFPERSVVPAPAPPPALNGAVAYAGPDAVRFALAATPPGGPLPKAEVIARHVLGNAAYAVRYAHAATAAVLRWAAALDTGPGGFRPRLLTAPLELALLDALSWLPERVAMAARRGRPDEFAGYLTELAVCTLDTMSTTAFTTIATIRSEQLWLADAARTGLAAGLELLGVDAPERI